MTDISPDLEELDEQLYKAEAELEKDFNDFVQLLLLAFLFRLRSLPESQRDVNNILSVESAFQRDLEKLYKDYFKKVSSLAEKYTKAELLALANSNSQKRRIEGIRIRQDAYNKRYAYKLARKQTKDLQKLLRNSTIKFLSENPDATAGQVRNLIRDRVKTFTELRGEITASTEANRVTNQVRLEAFKKSGIIKAVRFTAVLDKRTTPMCRSRHGTVVPLRSRVIVNYTPPLHPRCRSYLIPIDITDPAEVSEYQELYDIDEENPVNPTAEVVNSW